MEEQRVKGKQKQKAEAVVQLQLAKRQVVKLGLDLAALGVGVVCSHGRPTAGPCAAAPAAGAAAAFKPAVVGGGGVLAEEAAERRRCSPSVHAAGEEVEEEEAAAGPGSDPDPEGLEGVVRVQVNRQSFARLLAACIPVRVAGLYSKVSAHPSGVLVCSL